MISRWFISVLMLMLLSACDSGSNKQKQTLPTLSGPDIQRVNDPVLIAQGLGLYEQHCARCHGRAAEGDVQWRKPDAQGNYPAPPLDGSGHAWHHPRAMLHNVIKQGSPVDESGRPRGNMPAWGRIINDQEIDALIAWFQSLWPDQVYALWYERQQRARGMR